MYAGGEEDGGARGGDWEGGEGGASEQAGINSLLRKAMSPSCYTPKYPLIPAPQATATLAAISSLAKDYLPRLFNAYETLLLGPCTKTPPWPPLPAWRWGAR